MDQHKVGLTLLAAVVALVGVAADVNSASPAKAPNPARPEMLWDRSSVRTLPNGLPILHSRPGAPVSLFIDFQYESVNGQSKPFSLDKDFKTFSPAEQAQIRIAWAKVASAFAPFDVDVTTIEPAPDHPYIWQAVLPSGGGSSSTTLYVPLSGQKTATNGSQRADGHRWCGKCGKGSMLSGVIVHESGHANGIVGHEAYDEDGNYIGIQRAGIERGPFTRSVGPIGAWHVWLSEHGNPKKNPAGLFWVVNDIEIITRQVVKGAKAYTNPDYAGDGFRPDEHGNDIAHATKMTPGLGSGEWRAAGIIERYTDKDVFAFDWEGGEAWIGVLTAVPVPLLDARATLYDARGQLVAVADPAESMQAAALIENLPAGTYYLEVASDGDYGELGRYEATVTKLTPASLAPIALLDFDDNSLADAEVDRGHNAKWDGSPKWTKDPDGHAAARFDRTNRIIITPADGRRFASPGTSPLGRTFALRFKADDVSAAGEQVLLQSPGRGGYKLYLEGGSLKAHAINDGGLSDWVGGVTLSANVALKSDQWYHAALTHRTTFSRIDDTIALYLDGREVARGGAGPVPATSQFVLGGPTFAGAIDLAVILAEVPQPYIIAKAARQEALAQAPPAPVGGVTLTAVATHDTVTLRWKPSAGNSGWEVLRSTDNLHFALQATIGPKTATFVDTGLEPSRRYFYAVKSADAKKAGLAEVTTRGAPVHKPRFIRVAKDAGPTDWGYHRYAHKCEGKYGITLLWFGPYGHRDRSVRIERSTDGKAFKPIITLPSLERVYYDTNLAPATKYTYRLVTLDDAGEAASVTLTATSAAPAATKP